MRTLAVIGALIVLTGVIALDAPTAGGEPAVVQTIASEPRTVQSVCPGGQTIPVGDIATSGDVTLDSGSTDVRFDVLPHGGQVVDAGVAFDLVGILVERIGTGDIAGLAGMTCAPAANDQWLVGGATTLGSSGRLVLSNPAPTSVSVVISLYTPAGEAQNATTVVIGPGAQRVLLLEALEPEMPGLAVHVRAGGAGVSAALQDSRLDGFIPAGSDWVSASAVGTQLAIPVPATTNDDVQARVSMVAPEGATVTFSMVTEDGEVAWLGEPTHTLSAGVLTEIPVPAAGSGVVLIESTSPVVAAGVTQLAREAPTGEGDQAYDFAWTAAQRIEDSRTRASVVPPDTVMRSGTVELVAYASTPGTYRLDADGDVLDVALPAGQSIRMPIDLAPGTILTSDAPLTWALVVTDEPGFITTLEPISVEEVSIEIATHVGGYLP